MLAAYSGTPDPRLRELLAALIGHLHEFAVQTRLTPAEWLAAVTFLTAAGQKCDAERQEFILLSDVLGLSSLVDLVNATDGATESTVLGPFYVPGAPRRATGEQIGRPEDGRPALVRGRVTDPAGEPLAGASLDVWQCSSNGLYDIQDPGQPPFNLRGVFVTGPDGALRIPHGATGQLPHPRRRARSATCCAGPAAITGAPRTSMRSSPRRATRRHHARLRRRQPLSGATMPFSASRTPSSGSSGQAGSGDSADVCYVVNMDFAAGARGGPAAAIRPGRAAGHAVDRCFVKIGVVFPQTEIGADAGAVRAYAQRVRNSALPTCWPTTMSLGADPAVHEGWNGPYDVRTTFHEPLVLFGYLAALTSLELVTGIIILPQRQTALVAKQAAEVDLLTGGRFRLGVGLGWNAVEYEALGKNFTDRGRRMAEQVALLRRLWTEPAVTFDGRLRAGHRRGPRADAGPAADPAVVRRPVPAGLRPGRPARRRLVPAGAARAAAGRGQVGGRAGGRRGGPRPGRARHGGPGELGRGRGGAV